MGSSPPDAVRLLDLGRVSHLRSQAAYHAVAEAMGEGDPDTVILCSPDRPHFCVGFHQDPRQVLDLAWVAAQGLPVLRRQVGGGTTYLDSGQLYYQVVLNQRHAPPAVDALFHYALQPVCKTLLALGLAAELCHGNELVVRGRRIAGTGAARIGGASVVVGNFLFDFDYATMARAWRGPTASYLRLAQEGLERHLTTLNRELVTPPAPAAVQALLLEQYARVWGRALLPGEFTAAESGLVAEWEQRLGDPDWVFENVGAVRAGALKIADGVFIHHLAGVGPQRLQLAARVCGDVLDDLVVESPCGSGWEEVAGALVGAPLAVGALVARTASLQATQALGEEAMASLICALAQLGRR